MCSSRSLLPELLGQPDENSFGAPDVAEPIRIFVLDHFADELRAAVPEPGERIVDVLHGEHDAQVTESVHRGAAVIGDHRRREESGDLEPAVTVRRTHHGNLYAHVAQSSDAICPVSFDWCAPLELEAKFGEELNGGVDVFYHNADVVHALHRHDASLASNYYYATGSGSNVAFAGRSMLIDTAAEIGADLPPKRFASVASFFESTLYAVLQPSNNSTTKCSKRHPPLCACSANAPTAR